MMKLPRWSMALLMLGLVACGSDEPPPPPPPGPPPPKIASLTIKTAADVNPNDNGLPSPVVVHVYQLSGVTAFVESDFFQLQQDAAGTLEDELVATDTFVMLPGGVEVYQREVGEDVRFLGVVAAFRDLSAGKWRSFQAVAPATVTLLEAVISGTEVNMRKAGL